jgi:cyclophilin family peptidyl-prolyl cis-trans isomerase
VIQGGDPFGTGAGGPGYQIVEAPPKTLHYTYGVVAMAKTATDPVGTSGSQFFIVSARDAQLPPYYALLGKVTSGSAALNRIATLQTDSAQRPLIPVVIEQLTVSSG